MKFIRVLHCPTTVGGNPQELARSERELGLNSWSVTFSQDYLQYKTDEVLLKENFSILKLELKRWQLLKRAIKDFDIIHFNFGTSIMPQSYILKASENVNKYSLVLKYLYACYTRLFELKDLPLLKKLGKGIVVTYQGDDARQGDFCQANFEINMVTEVESGYYSVESDTLKRKNIRIFAKYADRIYALNPDLLHVLPTQAQFLPYSNIDLRDWQVIKKSTRSEVPLVLHAPSHRGVKGTRFILEAVSRLKTEGITFEFLLVEGLSHTEAKKLYEKADLLIDQLLVGWYGGLSVELMALGKPVICYLREGDLKFLPQQMRQDLPIIKAKPDTIYQVLKQWLTVDKHKLTELGQQSRVYVEKWHNPLKIAAQLQQEYKSILVSKRKRYGIV